MRAFTTFAVLAAVCLACLAPPASADREGFVRTHVRIDIPPEILHNDCTGEDLLVTGFLHQMFFHHVDAGGQTVFRSSGIHDIQHSNGQGLSAVGVESGETYRVQVISNTSSLEDFYSPISEVQDFANVFTERIVLSFSSPGGHDNFHATALVHVTVNANGEPTAVVENISGVQCR
jgi:hypothetical protein